MKDNNGFYLYKVCFIYKDKHYECHFHSTAEITPDTNKMIAWDLADDAIKEVMNEIQDKVEGAYPDKIVLYGEFGSLVIKD